MDWLRGIQFAQLVNAGYLKFEGQPYTTPGYKELATLYANDLATLKNPDRGNNRVIIGLVLQSDAGEAVIVFRGTEGIKEWVQDAQFLTTPFREVPNAGGSEDGFTEMYRSTTVDDGAAAIPLLRALAGNLFSKPVTSLTIAGHSLGGALATLCALDVAANAPAAFRNPAVFTYASPRTGDRAFAAAYGQRITNTYRYVDNVDLVPKLPKPLLVPLITYTHVCAQIEMDSLTLIPPRALLQPNPVCWHILSSYLYLMALASNTPAESPEPQCVWAGLGRDIHEVLDVACAELSSEQHLKDRFYRDPRRNMGANRGAAASRQPVV
jgi:pimeloyl-ACP methyl ester carboxylesterase